MDFLNNSWLTRSWIDENARCLNRLEAGLLKFLNS